MSRWFTAALRIATILAVTGFGSTPVQLALADDECDGSTLTAFWVATANGAVQNGFPILYIGFSSPAVDQQAVAAAAACAGVSQP